MRAVNPATEEVLREYPDHDADEVARRLGLAATAFAAWRDVPVSGRAGLMRQAAEILRRRTAEFARLMTLEMGKPIVQAEAEVAKCGRVCDFYAENAERFLAPVAVRTEAAESVVRFDPLGPVLAVMPWNFPFWQVFRFAAPTIVAGNACLLKHASNVPGCALAIEDVFREAGFPVGTFQGLAVGSRAIPDVIRHPAVAAVTLTGSEPAGRTVAATAGEALKKTVLELGGSDPFLVLGDADVEAAAFEAAKARCINNGQSCIAAKRFLVVETVADRFEELLILAMKAMRVGDPLDRATEVGPLAREDLVSDLEDQVQRSAIAGARVRTGGMRLGRRGFFFPPTVLTGVEPGMAVFDEETFGPVAAVTRCRNTNAAVALANRSRFGLGASLWTRDLELARILAARLEVGSVFVNEPVKSDPRVPFGGVKQSGYGRELSVFGIREFTNVKTVWVK